MSVCFAFLLNRVFLIFKSLVFLLLKTSSLFEFLLSPLLAPHHPPPHTLPSPLRACLCSSMPRTRESLNQTKARLSQEQRNRTERRVRELLHPRIKESTEEIFNDSEEDDRLEARRQKLLRHQEARTDSSSSFVLLEGCCWTVCCVVFVDLSCFAGDRCQTQDGKAKVRRCQEEAQGKAKGVRHVGGPLRLQDQLKKQRKRV